MSKKLGELCKECKCSKCGVLPYCCYLNGDTEAYCDEECKGENHCMTQCSMWEPGEVQP